MKFDDLTVTVIVKDLKISWWPFKMDIILNSVKSSNFNFLCH